MATSYELFHVLTEPGSARMRRLVVDLGLSDVVRLRNLYYPEVSADFGARGGTETPAVWDGATLLQGEAAVAERLNALAAAAK